MFGLLRLAFLLLICFAGIGWYRGWFSLNQSVPDPQTNRVNVNVSLDKSKIRADLAKAEQNLAKRLQESQTAVQGQAQQLQPQGQWPVTIQSQGQYSGAAPNPNGGPGLSIGPVSIQTPAPAAGQTYSFGPISVQPQAAPPAQQDYQYSAPYGQSGGR